jgi:opacity protein-like surface antigen
LLKHISIVVIFLLGSVPLCAQERDFNIELTPFGAYRVGGRFEEKGTSLAIKLDESESYGFIFNARHSPNTWWEILYSRQETTADATGLGVTDPRPELTVEYLQAGGTYMWDGERVRPFLAATLGGTRVDVSTAGFDSDTFWSGSLGLGLQIAPTSRLGLRLEARGYGSLLDSSSDLWCQFGPMNNVCAVRIDGKIMWQVEALLGIVFRF